MMGWPKQIDGALWRRREDAPVNNAGQAQPCECGKVRRTLFRYGRALPGPRVGSLPRIRWDEWAYCSLGCRSEWENER